VDKLLKSVKHWQVPVVGLLGLWFAVSPWLLGYGEDHKVLAANVVLGLAILASAVVATRPGRVASAAWSGFVLGLVAAISAWVLGHGDDMSLALNAVATGLVTATLSCMLGFSVADPDSWWNDRVAH
jgi:hypothetical protein